MTLAFDLRSADQLTFTRTNAKASDDALLAAIAAGDHAALTVLYQRHSERLRVAVRAVIGKHDATIAEDAVADVFVALAEGRAATFHPARGRALAWLKGIACGAAGEHLRARTSARVKKRAKKPSMIGTADGGES